jgi:hypothetical protein
MMEIQRGSFSARLQRILTISLAESITEDDDPQLGYLTSSESHPSRIASVLIPLAAWSHVANALGEDFEPWVAPVMERMLHGALQPVKVKAYEGMFPLPSHERF